MKTVGTLAESKAADVWSVRPDATAHEALQLMAEKDIGAVLVMDGPSLVGILSERDCARKVTLQGRSANDTLVDQIMTPRVLYVRAGESVEACMALMTDKHIRHVPVLDDDNRVVAVISLGDLAKAIIAQQQFTIAYLEQYISSTEAAAHRTA